MGYEVQTPVFEGPLDVLLHLITKQQVELYEISISEIVDGFLGHLDNMQRVAKEQDLPLDLETITQFLLIAATLVELKTRRLLPGQENVDLDDELALWEERDLLLARLVECKTFKDAAGALVAMEDNAKQSYARRAGLEEAFLGLTPDLLEGVSLERFRKAFIKATSPKPEPPKVSLDHVTQIRITVQDAMDDIMASMPNIKRTTFRRMTSKYSEAMEVIVHFLGVLELYKQGYIDIEQAITFGEMEVTWMGGRDGTDADAFSVAREHALADAYEG